MPEPSRSKFAKAAPPLVLCVIAAHITLTVVPLREIVVSYEVLGAGAPHLVRARGWPWPSSFVVPTSGDAIAARHEGAKLAPHTRVHTGNDLKRGTWMNRGLFMALATLVLGIARRLDRDTGTRKSPEQT